jgi:hypothetical protein
LIASVIRSYFESAISHEKSALVGRSFHISHLTVFTSARHSTALGTHVARISIRPQRPDLFHLIQGFWSNPLASDTRANMKFRLLTRFGLLAIVAITRVTATPTDSPGDLTLTDSIVFIEPNDVAKEETGLTPTLINRDDAWDKAIISGGNLWAGMRSDDRKASFFFRTDPHSPDPLLQSVQSLYDGDLKDTLLKWGYNENDELNAKIDKECDFDTYHHIKRAFNELGMKTESSGKGGPNHCFEINHFDGPKVMKDKDNKLPGMAEQKYTDESCGKEYRVSYPTSPHITLPFANGFCRSQAQRFKSPSTPTAEQSHS